MILLQLSQTGGETVITCSSQPTVSNRICARRYKRWGGTGCTVRNPVFRTRGLFYIAVNTVECFSSSGERLRAVYRRPSLLLDVPWRHALLEGNRATQMFPR